MPKHSDFQRIYKRFIKQYGATKGKELYFAWLTKKGYDDTKSLSSQKKEGKEFRCHVVGVEIKEDDLSYHIEGLIATSHPDLIEDIPDVIPKETLDSFAEQINSNERSRVFGIHHTEGRSVNPEYYGKADVENTPAKVIELSDGEYGLYVDTVLMKDDPKTPEIIQAFESGNLNSFSITYDTKGFSTTDFNFKEDTLVRILNPETELWGYTGASNPVNPNAIATGYGYKEFKELINSTTEVVNMTDKKEIKEDEEQPKETPEEEKPKVEEKEKKEENQPSEDDQSKEELEEEKPKENTEDEEEKKEFEAFKAEKKEKEMKEQLKEQADLIAERINNKMEVKEKVLKENNAPEVKEVPFEFKEFKEVLTDGKNLEVKEQFRRAASFCDAKNIDWTSATTSPAESREFKSFGTNGRFLEYKGLGITSNQNSDTDYLQSAAELQDVYDPVIYNALNQETVTWNLLAKDDYSGKGNNQVQFTLKTAANTSAGFYSGNAVVTGNVTRLKYQTKFKKLQVGVSVDGDMIAAARGGPVNDVFAQEVMDSTMDMLAVLNAALFDEKGAESDSECLGFEYITDSAGNGTLYNLSRSSTNKLDPDSASDTYIDQSSARISMTNLRSAIRQAVTEGADKRNLVFITAPVQGDILRSKFDDSRRMLSARNTDFGFSTDLFVDGIPVFEDKDCNTDDWFLVDLETHRVAIWVPPTIERLGKTADSEDAFIKMYFATYNRAPRRMVQIYSCATS